MNSMSLTGPDTGVVQRLSSAAATAPPWSEEAFLAAQDPAWADLTRCRERDECRSKLQRMGLME